MTVTLFDKHVEEFIEALDNPTRSRVMRTIVLLERFGNRITMPYSKNVERNLFELRTMGRPAVRLFYTFHMNCAVLLHGYSKRSQKIPRSELSIALKKLHVLTNIT